MIDGSEIFGIQGAPGSTVTYGGSALAPVRDRDALTNSIPADALPGQVSQVSFVQPANRFEAETSRSRVMYRRHGHTGRNFPRWN